MSKRQKQGTILSFFSTNSKETSTVSSAVQSSTINKPENTTTNIHGHSTEGQAIPAAFKRWQNTYKWLALNAEMKATCTICIEAKQKQLPIPSSSNCHVSLKAFVEDGFSCWKNALSAFKKHESGELHLSCVQAICNSKNKSVCEHLSDQKQKEMMDSRIALEKIFSTVNLLARQGLALRGSGNDEQSNLIQFLKTRSNDSTELATWLKRSQSKWLHHDIINEILECMSNDILRQKLQLIKSTKLFSLIVDETSDASRLEQVSICLRIVLDDLTVQEIFVGFYQTHSTTSNDLLKIIEDIFMRFNLNFNHLRGQCYDGAANMNGKISGLKSLILKKESRALFVHCSAHTLNLVVQDAMEDVHSVRNFIGTFKDLINFLRDSPKRLAIFKNLQSETSPIISPFCPTRWCMRVKSLKTLQTQDNYTTALTFFEQLEYDRHIDSSISTRAAGFRRSLTSFDFFFLLYISIEIFERIEMLNTQLQKLDLCFNEGYEMIKIVEDQLKGMRNSQFECIWKNTVEEAAQLNIDEPIIKRAKKVPKKYEYSSTDTRHDFSNASDYYRKLFFEILDQVLMSFNTRFDSETLSFLNLCENFVIGKTSEVSAIVDFFNKKGDDEEFILNQKKLILHRDMFLDIASKQNNAIASLRDVIQFSKKSSVLHLCYEFEKLIKFLLLVPNSSCTCERSFSALRRLKNYLRTTMLQKRLNSIALLNIHKEAAEALDMTKLINEFINKNKVRKATFAIK